MTSHRKVVFPAQLTAASLTLLFGLGIAQAQTLDAESQRAAQSLWDKVLTKCGNSYYSASSSISGGANPDARQDLVEYRDVEFRVVRAEVSSAERLNGVEWNGAARMAASAWRERNDNGTWGAFQGTVDSPVFSVHRHLSVNGIVMVNMWKTGGRWFYSGSSSEWGGTKTSFDHVEEVMYKASDHTFNRRYFLTIDEILKHPLYCGAGGQVTYVSPSRAQTPQLNGERQSKGQALPSTQKPRGPNLWIPPRALTSRSAGVSLWRQGVR